LPVYENVVCPFCGCTCDDLVVTVEGGRVTKVKNACAISTSKFQNYANDRVLHPHTRRSGYASKISLKEAVQEAAEMLADAKYPLLYGWASTTCGAQRIGIELAEEVGGVLDNTATTCHAPSILGMHDSGESTCTLGQVKHRADLVIYWGSNPVHAHPRHIMRYTVRSEGRFRKSRGERKLVVIDVRRTHTARMADIFLQVEPNKDYELISALRMIVKGEEVEQEVVAGIPVEKVEELADILINCEFGVIFFGLGLTMSAGKSLNIDAALSLVRDLNERTKFLIMPMRGHFNVTGANIVSTWQTGYSFAVDFSQGYPRYNPGDTTAIDLVCRGDCDAALVVASDPVAHWPRNAVKNLFNTKLAVIDPKQSLTSLVADTVIPSAMVGVEAEGTIYRMDGVPLILRKIVNPPEGLLKDEEILSLILRGVKELKGN